MYAIRSYYGRLECAPTAARGRARPTGHRCLPLTLTGIHWNHERTQERPPAEGILDVANTAMERAIRVISVERGYDPREFTLFSFGGAGGMHAAFLARLLSIPKVLLPRIV